MTDYIPALKASSKSYPCYFNSHFIVMPTSKSVGKYSPTVFIMINLLTLDDSQILRSSSNPPSGSHQYVQRPPWHFYLADLHMLQSQHDQNGIHLLHS